jgi:hypothetical protein
MRTGTWLRIDWQVRQQATHDPAQRGREVIHQIGQSTVSHGKIARQIATVRPPSPVQTALAGVLGDAQSQEIAGWRMESFDTARI